jgi:hypothetical protein
MRRLGRQAVGSYICVVAMRQGDSKLSFQKAMTSEVSNADR